jgi:hypothetical protein
VSVRAVRFALGFAAVFGIGLLIGGLAWNHTVTGTRLVTTFTATGAAPVPPACLEAVALTRKLELNALPSQITALTTRFNRAASNCQIVPPGCVQALTYFPQIVATEQRAELRALGRAFKAAAATCD